MKPLTFGVRVVVVAACVAAFAGCQHDPYADDFTITKPKTADVVGTYALSEQTVTDTLVAQLKARDGSAPASHTLVLRYDGTFAASNAPVWVEDRKTDIWSVSYFKSFSGKWKVETTGSVGSASVWGVSLSPNPAFNSGISFSGPKSPYKIILTYGDPDEEKVMIYERQSASVAPVTPTNKGQKGAR